MLMCVCVLRAQTITSYTCDFENPAENAQWVLNEVAATRDISQCANTWYIGAAGGFGVGSSVTSSGLYISSDGGATASYSNSQSVFITASRALQLAQGTYSVVFDWEAMGAGTPDGLYVFWVEDVSTKTFGNWSDRTNLAIPPYVTNAARYGSAANWRSSAFTFTTAGNGGKLVVLWLNTLTPAVPPAGKVDNICIYQGSPCPAPTNVRYNGNTKTLSWSGAAASYDVLLYNYHTQTMSSFMGLTSTSMLMPDLNEEGYYYIYVRSVCDEGHSTWSYTEKFVWIKGARCIDLFDLTEDNSGAAKCFAGSTENIKETIGQIDFGYADELSQHTIHYVQGERDPRTGNQLKTIPDGEIASVRLGGHWLSDGNMSSTVEYQYSVQAGVSDLLELKYATILEYADYHSESEEARFKLEILSNGVPVSGCAQRDFKAGYGETSSWHTYTYHYGSSGTSTREIYWSDWQTITVSLRDYVNQTLTIRLTAYSCTATIHIGYAYFTLNCKGGDLQGIACGDFSTDHFEAPEGFNYRWYRADDPSHTVLGTGRVFNIERDDPTVYVVDIIDPNKPTCHYTLEANPNPRFPQAKGSLKSATTAQCSNIATLAPDCHVVRINRQTLDSVITDEPVESIIWNFGDGSEPEMSMEPQITHAFPPEGGEYDVTVKAGISGGVCEDSYTFRITLPDLTTPDIHDSIHYCEEGVDHSDTTILTNSHGCDYKKVVHYMYHPTYETSYYERICEGGRYLFPGDGKYYTSSVDTTLQLVSRYGCDSLISLQLVVDPRLEVEYPTSLKVCMEDRIMVMPYRVLAGSMDSIKVYFSEEDQQRGFLPCYGFANGEEVIIPLPEGARPDLYNVQIEFGGERCQMDIQSMQVMLTYPTSVVMQNGGFIAVQNEDYNGGYMFVRFEWYKDGERIDTDASYIPTSPADEGATYVLNLVREGEKYAVETCPIVYNPRAQGLGNLQADEILVWPTAVQGGTTLWIAAGEACTIYNVLGTAVARYPQSAGVRTVTAPVQTGMYFVVFDNHKSQPVIVR